MTEINDYNGAFLPDGDVSLVLRCTYCAAEIELYGDWDEREDLDTYTLNDDEIVTCTCGARYGADDTLDIVF
jgi:hypothetical protein